MMEQGCEDGGGPKEMFSEIEWLTDKSTSSGRDKHVKLSKQIYKRLVVRHALLHKLEEFSQSHLVHAELEKLYKKDQDCTATNLNPNNTVDVKDHEVETNSRVTEEENSCEINKECSQDEEQNTEDTDHKSKEDEGIPPALRAYRLAVTDLFVEKALAYLERQADRYKLWGALVYFIAFCVIASGTCLAVFMMVENEAEYSKSWLELLSVFMRGFTAYGMIVLTAVSLSRFGKAMLDQAERLLERRHALRQGRLFVHLNKGQLSISELESAFNWNVSQNNAFGNLATDAKAPMGALAKELSRVAPELMKAGIKATSKTEKGTT